MRRIVFGIKLALVSLSLTALVVVANPSVSGAASTASLDKNTGINFNDKVTIRIQNTWVASEPGNLLGVSVCGNVKTDGSPITDSFESDAYSGNCVGGKEKIGSVLPQGTKDCTNASGFFRCGINGVSDGETGIAIGAAAAGGTVAAKTYEIFVNIPIENIGTEKAKCVPTTESMKSPCYIAVSPANGTGQITNAGEGYPLRLPFVMAGSVTTPGGVIISSAQSTPTTVKPATSAQQTQATTAAITAAPVQAAAKILSCSEIPNSPKRITSQNTSGKQIVLSKSKCIADNETITVSAPAGAFKGGETLFISQCSMDPDIPRDGTGCYIPSAQIIETKADGSVPETKIRIKAGVIGSNPLSSCPPAASTVAKGFYNCAIGVTTDSVGQKDLLYAEITMAGQTLTDPNALPVTGASDTNFLILGLAVLLVDFGILLWSAARSREFFVF